MFCKIVVVGEFRGTVLGQNAKPEVHQGQNNDFDSTTFLDVRYQLELLELLKALNHDRGLSIITVLHEINLAARYSDRICMIKAGEIAVMGTPEAVLTQANLAHTFGIQTLITKTAVGLMVYAIASCPSELDHHGAPR